MRDDHARSAFLRRKAHLPDARPADPHGAGLRGGDCAHVVLVGVLEAWLRDHNEITYKSRTYTFGQADIREAIRKLTIQRKKVRDWTTNLDVQNEMRRAIDEYLYDALKVRHDIPLSGGDLDVILDGLIDVAKHRDAL